jgi:hypothetical protein
MQWLHSPWAAFGLLGLFLALVFGIPLTYLALKKKPLAEEGPERIVYTRDEFRAKVIGKTQNDVLSAVGKPDRTIDLGDTTTWTYRDRARDAITGKLDGLIQVTFQSGRAMDVSFG